MIETLMRSSCNGYMGLSKIQRSHRCRGYKQIEACPGSRGEVERVGEANSHLHSCTFLSTSSTASRFSLGTVRKSAVTFVTGCGLCLLFLRSPPLVPVFTPWLSPLPFRPQLPAGIPVKAYVGAGAVTWPVTYCPATSSREGGGRGALLAIVAQGTGRHRGRSSQVKQQ